MTTGGPSPRCLLGATEIPLTEGMLIPGAINRPPQWRILVMPPNAMGEVWAHLQVIAWKPLILAPSSDDDVMVEERARLDGLSRTPYRTLTRWYIEPARAAEAETIACRAAAEYLSELAGAALGETAH